MKDFLYFPSMTKGSLALLYFPRFKSPDSHPASDEVDKRLSPFDGRVIRNGLPYLAKSLHEPPGDTDQPASGQPRIALQALWNRMKAIKCHKVS